MSDSTRRSESPIDPEEAVLSQALGSRQPSCPPLRLLLAAGQDVLAKDVEQRVQEHKEHCSLCQGLITDLAMLHDASLSEAQFERMRPRVVPELVARPVRGWMPSWPVLAMAAALLVMLASWLTFHRRLSGEPQIAVTHEGFPPPAQVASLQMPRLPLAPPDADATGLLTRGGGSAENPSVEELMPAFAAYNKGDYARAEELFKPLVSAYPKGDIAPLYRGVSQLMLHQDEAAYASLSAATRLAANKREDAAQWYTAAAAQETHPIEARGILSALCANKHSAYSAESCRIIRSLQQ